MNTELTRISRSTCSLSRRLNVGGNKHRAQLEAADVLVEVRQHREVLDRTMSSVEGQFANEYEAWFSRLPVSSRPAPVHYQMIASRWMRVGGWALIVFESILAGWLSKIFLVLPAGIAVTIGIAMALILAFAAKGLATVLLARYSETPIEARDHLIRWIRTMAAVLGVLLIALFYLRASTDPLALRLIWMFGAISALVSFVTPTLSGLLFACCELFGWSGRHADMWQRADRLDRSLHVVEQATRRTIKDAGNEGQRQSDTENTSPCVDVAPRSLYSAAQMPLASSRTVALMLLTASLIVGGLHPHQLAAQGAPATMSMAVATPAGAAAIYSDGSGSVLAVELQAAKREVVRVVPLVSRTLNAVSWSITTWSDDAWTVMPHTTIAWPLLALTQCGAVHLSEAETLFAVARARRLDQAKAKCDVLRAGELERYRRDENRAVTALTTALAVRPSHVPRCTSLSDLLQRIAAAPAGSTIVALSDGIESCSEGKSRVIQTPVGAKVVLVLLSPATVPAGGRAEHYERRRAEINRIAPWAIVTPVWGLERALLGEAPRTATASPKS